MADINIRNKIALDAGSNSGVKATVSNFTWNHTVGSLTRGILIVGVAARGAASNANLAITGITYNGVALIKRVAENSNDTPASNTLEAEIWYLKDPPAGTNTISVTFTGTVNHAVGYALSLSQVDQANPTDSFGSNHALGQSSPVSNNVTINNDNGWAFDVIYQKIGTALTRGAGQTLTSTELFPNGGGDTADSSYKGPVSPAAATPMSWSYTGSDDYAQALATFTPAPIQDAVSVTESVSVSIQSGLSIGVSDSTSVSESIGRMLQSHVSKSESTSVSESVKSELNSFINKSDSISVSDTLSVSYPLMQTLRDDFEFAYLDDVKWNNFGGVQVVVANKRLELTSTTSANYYGVTSNMAFNLTGSYAFSQLVNAGNQGLTSWEVYPVHLSIDANNAVSIMISGGTVFARKKVSGASSTVGSTVPYNSTTMQWFRIRESGGTTYWEYAQDPTSTWTTIASVANPIAVTALKGEVIVGTWQAEASTTAAYVDNFNLTPGQLQFSWKGYTWNKRVHLGDSMFNDQWEPVNVSGPDGSDYITLSLTNPTGDNPVGAEFFTDQRGFGYGTYITVIGTRLDTLHGAVVFGGLFTFDFTAPPDYREIDVDETYKYNGNPTVRLLHSHVYNNGGVRAFITDDVDIPSDQVQTHRMVWAPGKITFDSFIGTGTGGTLIAHHEHTTNVPTPGSERAHFNLWVANQNSPKGATPTDVVIRDFTFVASEQVTVSDSISVTENKNVALAHQINVSDSISVADTPSTSLVMLPRVSDSISASENVSMLETARIAVSDSASLSEAVVMLLLCLVSVSDSTSLSESVNAALTHTIAVSDTINTAESTSELLISNINVSDTTSPSESVNVTLVHTTAVSDTASVSETTKELLTSFIAVSDSMSMVESVSVNIVIANDLSVSVQDAATVSESVALLLSAFPSVSDSVSVTDTPSADITINTGSPYPQHVQTFSKASIPAGWQEFGNSTWTYDGATATDTTPGSSDPNKVLYTAVSLPQPRIVQAKIKFNSLANTDDRNGISILCNGTNGRGYNLNLRNGNTLQFLNDIIAWGPSTPLTVVAGEEWWFKAKYNDGVFYGKAWKVGDAEPDWMITWAQTPDETWVYSGINGNVASKATNATFDDFTLYSVDDVVTVTESVRAAMVHTIHASDTASTSESVTARSTENIAVSDTTSVTDTPGVALAHQISVSDMASIAEAVDPETVDTIAVSDSISITESVNMLNTEFISVNDSATVSESVIVSIQGVVSTRTMLLLGVGL